MILPASQKVNLVSITLYVILYYSILFHLLPCNDENEYTKVPTLVEEKGSSHELGILETEIKMLLDVISIMMLIKPHLDL